MNADQTNKQPRPRHRTVFLLVALAVLVLGGAVVLKHVHTPLERSKQGTQSPQGHREPKPTPLELGTIPFDCDHDDTDQTLQLMRRQAIRLASAMDNPKHPCNPLKTSVAKITGVKLTPFRRGNKMYTIWISDGTTTCGLETLHSEGGHPEIFKGDFFTRFFLSDFEGGYNYQKPMFDEVLNPGKKRFQKEEIGEAAHDLTEAVCGAGFFSNTLQQQYSGFSVSDGCNVGYASLATSPPSAGDAFTKNVVIATLTRTDIPQANPYNFSVLSKIKVYVQAEPLESALAFKVVYVDAGNNGFDPAAYGRGPNAPRQGRSLSAVRLR